MFKSSKIMESGIAVSAIVAFKLILKSGLRFANLVILHAFCRDIKR